MDDNFALGILINRVVRVESDIGIGFPAVRADAIVDAVTHELAIAPQAGPFRFLPSFAFGNFRTPSLTILSLTAIKLDFDHLFPDPCLETGAGKKFQKISLRRRLNQLPGGTGQAVFAPGRQSLPPGTRR